MPLKTLLIFALLAQLPVDPEDKSPQKAKHERTVFYAKDGKTVCGIISQYDSARWHVFLDPKLGITVPRFETRDDAAKWVKVYCPVEGKKAFKK